MKLAIGSALALLVSLSLAPAHAALGAVPVAAAGPAFLAPVVLIHPGDSVQWIGVALPHTVTTNDGLQQAIAGTPNDAENDDGDVDTFSVDLPMGSSYTHRFDTPGVYTYHCEVHSRFAMVGVVIVQEPDTLP